MRDAPIRHMTLLAHSDAAAEQHAGLLSRRPNLRSASLLRWFEWQRQRLPQLQGRDRSTHALITNLTAGLHSLVIGEFALTSSTIARLDRYARCAISTSDEHAFVSSATGCGLYPGLGHTLSSLTCKHNSLTLRRPYSLTGSACAR